MFHEIVQIDVGAEPIKNPVVVLEKDGTGRIEELRVAGYPDQTTVPHVGCCFVPITLAGQRRGDAKEAEWTRGVAFAFGKSFAAELPDPGRDGWRVAPEACEPVTAALRTYVESHLPTAGVRSLARVELGMHSPVSTIDSSVRLVKIGKVERVTNILSWMEALRLATLQDSLWVSSVDDFVCGVVRTVFPVQEAMVTAHRSASHAHYGLEVRIHKGGPIVGKLFVPLRANNAGRCENIAMLVNNAAAGQIDAAAVQTESLDDFHGVTTRASLEESAKAIQHLVHDVLVPYMNAAVPPPTRF